MQRPGFLMVAILCSGWLALAAPGTATAAAVGYDPSLGTLPELQGWTFVNGAPPPPPSVSGGILFQGPTGDITTQWWQRQGLGISCQTGFAMEIVIKVISSNYTIVGNGTQRSGFTFEAVDNRGRRISLSLAGSGVTLNTDATLQPNNGIPHLPFSTGGTFHRYTVTAQSGRISLFIDDTLRATTPVGDTLYAGTADTNLVYFGDGTGAAGSQTQIRSVRYGDPATVVGVRGSPTHATRLSLDQGVMGLGRTEMILRGADGRRVDVQILDARGALVRSLGRIVLQNRATHVWWDGKSSSGRYAASGIYFVRASADGGVAGSRMVLIR